MKAIIYEEYGPPEVLQLKEVAKPSPQDNKVLIKIHASTVNIEDPRLKSLPVPPLVSLLGRLVIGLQKPRKKIPGFEFAGEIEAVGKRHHRNSLNNVNRPKAE